MRQIGGKTYGGSAPIGVMWALVALGGCVDDGAAPGVVDAEPADAAVDAFIAPPLDMAPDVFVGAGFGEPCEDNGDCASGYCVEGREAGRFCTRTCGECPEGLECVPVGNAGPDRTFLCLVDQPDLCKPCETDRECDDPADRCLPIGLRTYCGEDCSVDGVCPEGYACFEFERGDEVLMQCAPADGEGCRPCLDRDGDGYGEGDDCLGFDCDDSTTASYPGAAEACDGRDNDCDSVSDEDVEEIPNVACLTAGLCRGTRPVCAEGGWRCDYPEGYSEGAEAACDGVDDDCDGMVDEDYDRQTDAAHCGVCGVVCDFAHAASSCVDGRCVRGACDEGWYDADRDPVTGCEYLCAETLGGVEACDGIDNDCDALVDEGFDGVEICNALDDDCDGMADEGFDLLSDATNCGGCGQACVITNATARCGEGRCAIDACVGGFWDINGSAVDGCEYACQPTAGGVEVCDGVDNDCNGTVDDGIDLSGDLANCGRCGNVCRGPAGRVVSCEGGECMVGGCAPGVVDADGDGTCEYACVPRGAEVCDGIDDDCDTRVDEGVLNACGQCGAVPVEVCDGIDNDCDGVIDDGGVCGPYVAERCRLFVGWADRGQGPASGSASWGNCPPADRLNQANLRCTGTRRDGRFARLQTNGDVNEDDEFGVALLCDDASNSALATYIQSHCAVYWGQADEEQGLDDSPTWGPCPAAAVGVRGEFACTSSGFDGRFRKVSLVGDINGDDSFGVAWICRDQENPARAAALQQSVAVFVGWADRESGPADGSARWGPCPGEPGGQVGAQRCTSTRGRGRFQLLRIDGDANDDDQFGFALRALAP